MIYRILHFTMIMLNSAVFITAAAFAQAGEWQPVTGADNLRAFMAGTKLEWKDLGGDTSRGEYRDDGSGILYAWGASFPRQWETKGDDQICVTGEPASQCYRLEKSKSEPTRYRAIDVATGTAVEIHKIGPKGRAVVSGDTTKRPSTGGPAAASASEMAAELSNPNTALASLTLKNIYTWYEGDLRNADDQSNYTMLFQPVLPFPLEKKGTSILWRPAVPLLLDQPLFDASRLDFDEETGIGDISMDLAYSMSSESGWLTAFGLFTVLPTATNSRLASGRWSIGPEVLIAKKTKKYIAGIFPSHRWDVAGWSDRTVNVTNLKLIATLLPGGGWSVGSNPALNYNWDAEQWTIPVNLTLSKTIISSSGRPWKLALEADYFVEKSDAFGPRFRIGFNITPVVKNGLAELFK